MKNTRLSLKRETLAELNAADLRSVVGAAANQTIVDLITQIIDPPSNTHACSDSC